MNIETILVVGLVLVALAMVLGNNLAHKQYAAIITDLSTKFAAIVQQAQSVVHPAPTPQPAPSISQVVHAPAAAPAPVPDAPSTFNGMLVPPGMTLAEFTQLGLAVQGVLGMLAPSMAGYLLASTQLWFDSLGDYWREALVRFSTDEVHSAMTLRYAASSQPKLSPTENQWAAATNAVTPVKA